jgi:hypothetical protein
MLVFIVRVVVVEIIKTVNPYTGGAPPGNCCSSSISSGTSSTSIYHTHDHNCSNTIARRIIGLSFRFLLNIDLDDNNDDEDEGHNNKQQQQQRVTTVVDNLFR